MKERGEEGPWSRPPARASGVFGDIPFAVTALAILSGAIFAALALAPPLVEERLGSQFGFSPERLVGAVAQQTDAGAAALTLFTHALLHASTTHLLFNLLWLFVFGTPIARRMGAIRFYFFFLFSAAVGALFFGLFHLDDKTLLIGASGGISGLLGGLVRFAFHRPNSRPASAHGVLPLGDRSVLAWSAVVVLMNASVAIFGPGVGAGDADIAWQAHIGGFLFGLIAFPLFDRSRR